MNQMQRSNKSATTPTTWIVTVIVVLGFGVLLLTVSPSYYGVRTVCLSQLKQVDLSSIEYSSDYDDRMPLAWDWIEVGTPYLKSPVIYHCPEARGAYGYAYNSKLSGVSYGKIAHPQSNVAFYDSTTLTRDAADPVSSLPSPGRHRGSDSVTFLDGHAKSIRVPGQQLDEILKNPG
jgi:hypothetical protein